MSFFLMLGRGRSDGYASPIHSTQIQSLMSPFESSELFLRGSFPYRFTSLDRVLMALPRPLLLVFPVKLLLLRFWSHTGIMT